MRTWRLLPLRIDDAPMSMAIEEALLRLKAAGKVPNTVRFWRWSPSAVSVGCFQSVGQEVNLEAANRYRIEIVRRITGGGAVFHDRDGELTYSVVCMQDDVPADVLESYGLICGGLVRGFERLGIQAGLRPIEAKAAPHSSRRPCPVVQVNGRKISGSAQTRRWGSVLQHGTVLIDPNLRLMFELLRVSREKISDKPIASVLERVTTVTRELGRKPKFDEVKVAMSSGFEKAFGVKLVESDLTGEELKLAEQLRPKYASQVVEKTPKFEISTRNITCWNPKQKGCKRSREGWSGYGGNRNCGGKNRSREQKSGRIRRGHKGLR